MLSIPLRSVMSCLLLACAAGANVQAAEPAASIEVFAAGSLRGVVADLAAAAGPALHIEIKPTFGGSGALRERIEQGERPDLLLSADLASPGKLATAGLSLLRPVPFARNRMCFVSRRDAGLNADNLIRQLLAPATRIKTSTPVADPSGDYAWTIFDRIEQQRPGAGPLLKAKANAQMNAVAASSNPQLSAAAALFAARQIDVSITYCSASAALERELPALTSLRVPPALDPQPVYGMAVLSDKPAALRLALYLLSEDGQSLIGKNGLVPLVEPGAPRP